MISNNPRRMPQNMVEQFLRKSTELYEQLSPAERAAPLRPVWAERRTITFQHWCAAGVPKHVAERLATNEAFMLQRMGNESGDERASHLIAALEALAPR